MRNHAGDRKLAGPGDQTRAAFTALELPMPTAGYRRRAWLEFQRALDPLAPPKPLPRITWRRERHGGG